MTCQVAQGSVHYKLPSLSGSPSHCSDHAHWQNLLFPHNIFSTLQELLPFFRAIPLILAPLRPAHARPHVQSQNKQLGNLSS